MKKYLLLLFGFLVFSGCDLTTSEGTLDNREKIEVFKAPDPITMLKKINEIRKTPRNCQDGLGVVGPVDPLQWNEELYKSSKEHSYDMAMSNMFSHKGSGGKYDITGKKRAKKSLFYERIEENGYLYSATKGENLATGIYDFDKVLASWLKSPYHCSNIMYSSFSDVAIAISTNEKSTNGIYWTQDFGEKD